MAGEMNLRSCVVCNSHLDDGLLEKLKAELPDDHQYMVDSCSDSGKGLAAVVHVDVKTVEQTENWLKQYESVSKVTLRVAKTWPDVGIKVLFKKMYRCQHNSHCGGPKDTACPVLVTVTLRRTDFTRTNATKSARLSRSTDEHLPEFPLKVQIRGCHNHTIDTAAALRHRDVDPSIRKKFEQLFTDGYSPSAAYHLHQYDLQTEHGDQYYKMSGDRRYCPDKAWCYRLYYQLFHHAYGPTEVGRDTLRQKVEAINVDIRSAASDAGADETFIALDDNSDALIIAICTPLMKRVHRLVPHSAELVFVDASGNMDRQNARVFLLMTHSAAGGLPLGVLILSNEQSATISAALRLYLTMLDERCFGGRGAAGPTIFMTDDSTAERTALQDVFPDSTLLLCAFHILQAYWRFLWDSKTGVKQQYRQQLFSNMKAMLYASSEQQLHSLFVAAVSDATVQQHAKVLRHLQSLYDRCSEWALCWRSDLPVRSNQTNNYCESAMRVMKDKVLQRTKAFNVLQLIDFILSRLDSHYQRRLIDAANNRLQENSRSSRFLASGQTATFASIRQVEADLFEVPSETSPDVTYLVDMSVGCCGCPVGTSGGPCKHQAAVLTAFKRSSWNFLPSTDTAMRQLFYTVATGDTSTPMQWFAPLTQPAAENDNIQDMAQPTPSVATTTDTDPTGNYTSDDQLEPIEQTTEPDPDVIADLHTTFTRIEQLYRSDPDIYLPAVKSFCQQVNRASESRLESALHCFGKYTGAAVPAVSGRRRLTSLKTIGVQPTAVARRQMPVSGRKRCFLGRPPRAAFTAEHGYTANTGAKRHAMPKRRAPHNLSAAVSNVQSLGSTHSAK